MAKRVGVLVVLAVTLLVPASGHAAFPGANGKIAFVRAGDIWTMNPDGTGQVNLTNSAATERSPGWSPDGNRIVFDRNSEIWTMFADGSVQTDLNAFPPGVQMGPGWSPNGQKVVFGVDDHCSPGGVWIADADGTDSSNVGCIFDGDDRGYWDNGWAPDGSKIVFGAHLGKFDIYTVSPTAGNPATGTNLTDSSCCFDFNPNWSPDAQKIAWDRDPFTVPAIWTMNPDGTGQAQLRATGADPAWSPDGSKIVFVEGGSIKVMNSNGTGAVTVTTGDEPDWQPLPIAGPEADMLATITDSPDPIPVGGILTYNASAKNLVGPDTATGATLTVNLPAGAFFISATPTQGSCSQASGTVTCNLGNLSQGTSADVQIQVEPRNQGTNVATATADANEADPVPGNNAAQTTTTVTPGGYPRPKGASPIFASLVPAYRACSADQAALVHGPPLAHPSCGSPAQTSGYLTVGSPDANGAPANSIGRVRIVQTGELPINPNNGDQADVVVELDLTDVRTTPSLADYAGELRTEMTLRITDRQNTPSGSAAATVTDTTLSFDTPCIGTLGPQNIGSTCSISTTADALIPGMVIEGKRAIWELGRTRVFDGGPDGDAGTGPNTLFAVQGVFVP